jgi:dephospho-CoA kinase
MKRVGLTGGIASGKSTVAKLLTAKGAVVIDADVAAREVVEPGQPAYDEIVARWGREVLQADGRLDRAKLGAIVFADEASRLALNAMTHERVRQRMLDHAAELAASDSPPPVAVLDIPLLFENKLEKLVEETWVVWLDPDAQLDRLMARNGFDRAEAERRIASQLPLSEKAKRATRIIDNTGAIDRLSAEVDRVWREAGLDAPH